MFDRNINVDNTFGLASNSDLPKENPADPNSKSLETVFENLTTYKNRNGGFWGRGELFVVKNLKFADNAIGFTMSSGAFGREAFTSVVIDSLFVGETENIGNPVTPEEKAYGRSLPKRAIPDFPIHGYQYYDYRVDVANTTFVNYQDNKQREDRRAFLAAVHELWRQHGKLDQRCEIRQRQAGLFPQVRYPVRQRQPRRQRLSDPVVPRPGRLGDRHPRFPGLAPRRRERQRRHG
jgi:hypothetical protein